MSNAITSLRTGPRVRRVTMVRHGETVGESSIRYHGVSDVDLSDTGESQMRRVADALRDNVFDAVYTSTLRRTLASARIIAPRLEPRALSGFDEINFGRWEGLTRAEIEARDPELFREWRAPNIDFAYPGGDRISSFRARVTATWHQLLQDAPTNVLLVVHRGVISSILSATLGLNAAELHGWSISLGSIHVIVRNGNGWHAEVADRCDHIEA